MCRDWNRTCSVKLNRGILVGPGKRKGMERFAASRYRSDGEIGKANAAEFSMGVRTGNLLSVFPWLSDTDNLRR